MSFIPAVPSVVLCVLCGDEKHPTPPESCRSKECRCLFSHSSKCNEKIQKIVSGLGGKNPLARYPEPVYNCRTLDGTLFGHHYVGTQRLTRPMRSATLMYKKEMTPCQR